MDHSYSTDCSGDPENHSDGGWSQVRATQASCPRGCTQGRAQRRQGRNGYTLPALLSKVEKAGCIQKQQGEVSPHCRYGGGKGLAVPPAEEQYTLVSLIDKTCSIASSRTARKVLEC